MAQWVKVGNIRGPAGEIPDVSEFLKVDDYGYLKRDNQYVPILKTTNQSGNSASVAAAISLPDGAGSIDGQLIAYPPSQVGQFQARALCDKRNTAVQASAYINGDASFRLFSLNKETDEMADVSFGIDIDGNAGNPITYIGTATKPINAISASDINPDTTNGLLVPNLNTVKTMISGMVKATTDEEYGTGASLLTSNGEVVDSIVLPGTDGNYAMIGSKNASSALYFLAYDQTSAVNINVDNSSPHSVSSVTAARFDGDGSPVNSVSLIAGGYDPESDDNHGLPALWFTNDKESTHSYATWITSDATTGDATALATAKAVKDYTDTAIAAIPDPDLSGYLPKTGGTLTGNVDLNTGTAEPNLSIKRTVDGGTTAVEGRLRIDSDGVVGLRSIVGGTTVNNLYLEQTQTRLTKPLSVASGGVPQDGTVGQILKKGQNGAEWVDDSIDTSNLVNFNYDTSNFEYYSGGRIDHISIPSTVNNERMVDISTLNSMAKISVMESSTSGVQISSDIDTARVVIDGVSNSFQMGDKSVTGITDDASSGSSYSLATAKAVKDYVDALSATLSTPDVDEFLTYLDEP